MSGKLHVDGRNASNTAVGFTSKSSGTMPARYAKNASSGGTGSGGGGSLLSAPSPAARTSATLRPEDAGGGVKLRRHESSKSKGAGDTNRRSFLGSVGFGNWFKHKTESSESQKQSSQTGVTKATSDSKKKKDGGVGGHLMSSSSSLLRSSHLSDSMPSLVVPTAVHPAVVSHRQKDLPVSTAASTSMNAARSSRLTATGAGDRTSAAASRNRWSSYELVGSSLTVAEEEPSADVDDASADGHNEETSKRQSGEHKSLLQVNSLPSVMRARSAETLNQNDISDSGSTGSLSLSTNDNGNSSTPQRPLDNQNASGSSRSLSGPSTAVQHETPESQTKRRMLIASLRQTEAKLESTKRLRKKLWASLLNIPVTDFECVGELARQSSHRDGDQRELLLTSLLEADRLTSCVNRLLHLGVGTDVIAARTPSISISCSSDDSSTTSQQQHQQQQNASHVAVPDADHMLSNLTDLSVKLNRQLSLLMDAFVESEKETRRLTDRLSSVRLQIDDRRTKNANAPTPSSSCSSNNNNNNNVNDEHVAPHVAPPGESQHTVDQSSATGVRGGRQDAEEETEIRPDGTDSGPEVERSATDARIDEEATGEEEEEEESQQSEQVSSSNGAGVETTAETTTETESTGSAGHEVQDEADVEQKPSPLEQQTGCSADLAADPSETDAAAAAAGSVADDGEEHGN